MDEKKPSAPSEVELKEMWAETLVGIENPDAADPAQTFKPGAEQADSSSSKNVFLPTFSVSKSSDSGEWETNPTLMDDSHDGETTLLEEFRPSPMAGTDDTLGNEQVASKLVGGLQPTLYQLREEIGRGGMGVVFRAHQSSLGRDVAIKTVLPTQGSSGHAKFVAEALITGRLDHPNVVPVHDLGQTPGGDALLAMKLVEGTSWKRVLRPKKPHEKERASRYELADHLQVLITVCNAVAFAHSRGLAHLDLKPENVMIGEFGEVLVMDWGLAVDIRDDRPERDQVVPHRSTIRAPCGTPAYMPPELAMGLGDEVGVWTDVYLLGAILHELVMGKPPHKSASLFRTIVKACESNPPELDDRVPAELQVICLKALAKDPPDRYGSVEELQEALKEFLRHRESRQVSNSAQELLDRCRARSQDTTDHSEQTQNLVYADFAASVAGFHQARSLWEGNDEAAQGEVEARLEYAAAALGYGDLGLAEAQLAGIEPSPRSHTLVQEIGRERRLREQARRNGRILRWTLGGAILAIVVGLTAGYMLVAAEKQVAEQERTEAQNQREQAELQRAEANRQKDVAERQTALAEAQEKKARHQLAESLVAQADTLGTADRWSKARDKYRVATGLFDSLGVTSLPAQLGLFLSDYRSPRPLITLSQRGEQSRVDALAFAPQGDLVVVDAQGTLRVWDHLRGRPLHEAPTNQGGVLAVAVSSWLIATAGRDGSIRLWDVHGHAKNTLVGHTGPVSDLSFTATGKRLISASHDKTLKLWDVKTGELLATYKGHEQPIVAVAMMPLGNYAFSGSADGELIWWNVAPPGSIHWRFRKAPKGITRITYSVSNARFAVGLDDHTVRIWGWPQGAPNFQEVAKLDGDEHSGAVKGVIWSPDGKLLLSAGLDGKLVLWDTKSREVVQRIENPQRGALAAAVSWRGDRVALASQGAGIMVWDMGLNRRNLTGAERNREVLAFAGLPDELRGRPRWVRGRKVYPEVEPVAAALSPDGMLAAASYQNAVLMVWDAQTGLPLYSLDPKPKRIARSLAFSSDSQRLTIATEAGSVQTLDLTQLVPTQPGTRQLLRESWSDTGAYTVAVDPEARFAVGGPDGKVVVLRPKVPLVLDQPPAKPVTSLSWKGPFLLGGDAAGNLTLWHTRPQRRARTWKGHRDSVTATLLMREDRALSASEGGFLTLWNPATGQPLSDLPGHTDSVTQLAMSDRFLVSAGKDQTLRLWTHEGRELRTFDKTNGSRGVSLNAKGDQLLTAGPQGLKLHRFSRTRQHDRHAAAFGLAARILREAPDDPHALATLGSYYAFRGELQSAVRLLEAARKGGATPPDLLLMRCYMELGRYWLAREALARLRAAPKELSPAYLFLCHKRLEQLETGGSVLGREPGKIGALAISPDGTLAASGSQERTVTVWNIHTGDHVHSFRGHKLPVLGLAWSMDGRLLASLDQHGYVSLWDIASAQRVRHIRAHTAAARHVIFHPDGKTLITGGSDLAVWDLETGQLIRRMAGQRETLRYVSLGPKDQVAAIANRKIIKVWNIRTGELINSWKASPTADSQFTVWTPEGNLLTLTQVNDTLHEWDPVTGAHLRERLVGRAVEVLEIRPNRRLYVMRRGGEGEVRDLDTGTLKKYWNIKQVVYCGDVTPDGKTILSAGIAGAVFRKAVGD